MRLLRWFFFISANVALIFAAMAQPPGATNTSPFDSVAKAALGTFKLKSGFRLDLVAAEPAVSAPVAMAFDENSRLFVVERSISDPSSGRVRVLEDTDGDGVFENSKVFAESVPRASAVACWDGGIFVAATPEILYLKEPPSQEQPELRRIAFAGFGADPEKVKAGPLLNNFNWGIDSRIHGASAGVGGNVNAMLAQGFPQVALGRDDFSFDPRSFTAMAEAGPAHSGLCFDNEGRRFLTDPARPLKLPMAEPRYLNRNPFFVKAPPVLAVPGASGPLFRFHPPQPAGRGTNSVIKVVQTGASGAAVYRGALFPAAYAQNVFIPDSAAGVIHRLMLRESGTAMTAQRVPDESNTEFLMSRDPAFQPVQIINGPEGGLYVVDAQGGADRGRIFRIVPEKFQPARLPQLGKANTHGLVTLLAHTNGWQRDTAARLLYQRRDAAAVPLLSAMFNNSRLPLARLHSLYALAGLGGLREEHVLKALRHPDEPLRLHGLLLSETLIREGTVSDTLWFQYRAMAGDPSPKVAQQLAFTIGQTRRPEKSAILTEIFRRHFSDRWTQTAILSSLSEGAGQMFVSLAGDARWRNEPAAQPFLHQLLLMVGMHGREDEAGQALAFLTDAKVHFEQLFTYLYYLGEGLRRAGGGFPLIDRQNRLQRFYDRSVEVTLDETLAEQFRIAGIRFRGVSPYVVSGTGDFFQLLFNSGQSERVQAEAINTLGRYNNPAIPERLVSRWQVFSPALRNQAAAALLARVDGIPVLMQALQRGRISTADLSPAQIDYLRTYRDPTVSQAALNLFGPLTGERPEVVQGFAQALRMAGTASAGRSIFVDRCASCHQLGGEGRAIGPDLVAARAGGKQKLLTSILQPNVEVRPENATYAVQTTGGENLVGLLLEENPAAITLRQPDGNEQVWPRGNIESIERQPWSLMPVGLENGLSAQGMADLLEYISSTPD